MKKNVFIPVVVIITTLFFTLSSCGEKDKDDETPNQPPSCIISAPAAGQEIVTGTLVTIAVDADDADGSIAEVRFYVDDIGKGTAVAFPYNYSWNTAGETAGSHTIKATAFDNAGARTSDEVDIILTEAGDAPLAEFLATPLSGIAPQLVSFVDQSENDPVSWQWDFGDGNNSTEQNPLHTYETKGTYTVSLTVENSQGADTEVKSDYIVVVFGGGTGEPCPGIPTVSYGGQIYNTVLIDDQCWLKENLNIGSMISSTQNQSDNGGIEKYCYGNLLENCDIYGGLYQWNEMMQYVTTEGTQGICPPGWHIPADGEWTALTDHLGGVLGAGGKMKETGTAHWNSPNTGATNSSNFTALPGGISENGILNNMGRWGIFWSSTGYNTSEAYRLILYYNFSDVSRYRNPKGHGLSVRCLMD